MSILKPVNQPDISNCFKKVIYSFILFLSLSAIAVAQNFTPVDYGISKGYSAKWVDIDNDDDLDLIVPDRLYVNTGSGFNEISINNCPMSQYIDVFDVNNDSYMDFIISDYNTTKLFLNDGDNTFTQTELTPVYGPVTHGDLNNDGLKDFICSGTYDDDIFIYVYQNTDGYVYKQMENNLSGVIDGTIIIFDFDKDQKNDILLSGVDRNGNPINNLYKNEGNFEFTKQESFDPCRYNSSVNIADFDNNGWMDFIVSGYSGTWLQKQTNRNVYNKYEYNFERNREGSSKALNYDGDEDVDLLVSGFYPPVTKYYTKETNDSYNITTDNSFSAYRGTLAQGDYDKDSDVDYYVAGNDGLNDYSMVHRNNHDLSNAAPSVPTGLNYYTDGKEVYFTWNCSSDDQTPDSTLTYNIYIEKVSGDNIVVPHANISTGFVKSYSTGNAGNDTIYIYSDLPADSYIFYVQAIDNCNNASAFSEGCVIDIDFYFNEVHFDWINTPCHIGEIGLFDYDNDNDLDILMMAYNHYNDGTWKDTSMIFIIENSIDGYSPKQYLNFRQHNIVDFVFQDFNNDNMVDVFVGGDTSRLLINNGLRDFEEPVDYPASNYLQTIADDLTNDGFVDVLVGSSWRKHNGNLHNPAFETDPELNVPGGYITTSFDYNNDGKVDCFSSGNLFKNIGNSFENILSINYLTGGTCYPGDLDNDNDLDFIYSGWINELRYTDVYLNDGNDSFSLFDQNQIRKVKGIAFPGDFDNNGTLDLFVGGYSSTFLSELYLNDGNLNFREFEYDFIRTLDRNRVTFGDIDNDGDLDMIFMENNMNLHILYNNYAYTNEKPAPPQNLSSQRSGFGISLNWNLASDDHTPAQSLSYNLRIGSTPGGNDIISPLAESDGYRKIVGMGNCWLNTSWQLDSLPVGTYYWSVQAIDNAYIGGEWAPEESFTINILTADFITDTVCKGSTTSIIDNTYTSGETVTEWHWDFQDGTFSYEQNPQHIFPDAGTYNVKMVVSSATAIDSISKEVIVKAQPATNFTADIACQGSATNLINETSLNGTIVNSWFWDFGDGSTSDLENPENHGYLNAGDYNVKLRATATNGCTDSITNIVSVGSYPVAGVTANAPLAFCEGDSVTLSVPYNDNYLYTWKVDGTNLTDADSSKYIAKLTGDYSVEVINNVGLCTTTSYDVSVTVQDAPEAQFINADDPLTFCEGDSVLLYVTNNPDYTYKWGKNGGAVGENSNELIAKSPGSYTLTVSNALGCEAGSSNSIDIIVNESPAIPAVNLSGPTTFCQGESVIMSVAEDPAYTYQWRDEYGIIDGKNTGYYTASESGIYSLIISNATGCSVETVPLSVTVKPMPIKPILQTDNYTPGSCLGLDPVIIFTDEVAGYSYQWLRNGLPMAGETGSSIEGYLSEGDYSLIADLNGCTVESDIQTLDFENAPKKPDLYVKGPVVWYMAASNDTASAYIWYLNNQVIPGAEDYIYVANQTLGKYSVAVANEFGCLTISDELTIPVSKSEMTNFLVPDEYSIDGLDPFSNLRIYPNPTPGLFTVEMDNHIMGELDINIFTNEGRQILNIKFEKTTVHFQSQIDLSGQGNGIYLINLLLEQYAANRKIVVE